MSGSTKLMTPGGGGVVLTPASSIASDVTVNIPSSNGTIALTTGLTSLGSNSAGTPIQFNDSAGTQVGTLCRAWVCWTGSTGAVLASFNVSSVTRNAAGQWTIVFSTAFPDNKYVVTGSAEWWTGTTGDAGMVFGGDSTKGTAGFIVRALNYVTGVQYDPLTAGVAVFR